MASTLCISLVALLLFLSTSQLHGMDMDIVTVLIKRDSIVKPIRIYKADTFLEILEQIWTQSQLSKNIPDKETFFENYALYYNGQMLENDKPLLSHIGIKSEVDKKKTPVLKLKKRQRRLLIGCLCFSSKYFGIPALLGFLIFLAGKARESGKLDETKIQEELKLAKIVGKWLDKVDAATAAKNDDHTTLKLILIIAMIFAAVVIILFCGLGAGQYIVKTLKKNQNKKKGSGSVEKTSAAKAAKQKKATSNEIPPTTSPDSRNQPATSLSSVHQSTPISSQIMKKGSSIQSKEMGLLGNQPPTLMQSPAS